MKRILSAMILIGMLILPLLFSITASAETTTLSTSVPNQVTLSVEITGKGTITVNGQSTNNKGKFMVNRLADVKVLIASNSNYLLKAVYLNGKDVTDDLKDGLLLIENIQFDTNISVIFVRKNVGYIGNIPETGDSSHIGSLLLCWFGSLTMLIILLHGNRKKKQ